MLLIVLLLLVLGALLVWAGATNQAPGDILRQWSGR